LRYCCNSCTCFNIPHQHALTQHVCSSHAHAHTNSHPPHVTHLPSTGVLTGKLRPFCRPPVLTLVSLSLFNTFLVTLYVITTRIILQKPAVEEETSCCASATVRCSPAVEEETDVLLRFGRQEPTAVSKGDLARRTAAVAAVAALHAELSGEFQPAVNAERSGHRVHPPRLSLPLQSLHWGSRQSRREPEVGTSILCLRACVCVRVRAGRRVCVYGQQMNTCSSRVCAGVAAGALSRACDICTHVITHNKGRSSIGCPAFLLHEFLTASH